MNQQNAAPKAFNSPHSQTYFAWKQNTKSKQKTLTIQPGNSGCKLPLELILLDSAPRSISLRFFVLFLVTHMASYGEQRHTQQKGLGNPSLMKIKWARRRMENSSKVLRT